MHSAEGRAFVRAALDWHNSRDDRHARAMLRSVFSGVPHELGAAYVTLAAREGNVLELLARGRLSAGGEAREALLGFSASMREFAGLDKNEDEIRAFVTARFNLAEATASPNEMPSGDFALCSPVSREAGTALRAQREQFSASQLNAYVECPRKWFYRYLCGAIEDKGSSASFYGRTYHSALERFHGEYPRPGDIEPVELRRKLEGYLNSAFERDRSRFETAVEYELLRRRAQRTGRKYVEWLLAEASRAPFTVVGCELAAELQLEGYDFVGYIDRLDRDDATGAVTVLDYKTGTIATTAAQYRDQVCAFEDFQLPFYYWARTAQGDRVTRLALVPLKDARLDVAPIELEVIPVPSAVSGPNRSSGVIPIVELERARTRMIELCAELTSGTISHFEVTADADACTFCAYTTACERRPIPPEDRFSR